MGTAAPSEFPATAPGVFQREREFPASFGACQLCDYGRLGGTQCVHPMGTRPLVSLPCETMRQLGGACGPEAKLRKLK